MKKRTNLPRSGHLGVPREVLADARIKVPSAIQEALSRGMRRIDDKAAKFAGFKRTPSPRPFQFILKPQRQH
jgi:hypothetical protein